MTENIIEIENLNKSFDRKPTLVNINFYVKKGEIFGFLGPNGAGKTTTIRLLLNLLNPNSGTIKIFNKAWRHNNLNINKDCGYLPGNYKAYSHLNGLQYLKFCAKMRKISEQKFFPFIDKYKLSNNDLKKKIKHLSHGTLQKLGIIQAFFHKPKLLILDEPTIGLDPLIKEIFYNAILDYKEKGGSVFFSSHNLSEVEKVCNRIAFIKMGKIIAIEKINDLKKRKYRKLTLKLSEPVEKPFLVGSKLIEKNNNEYIFMIKGENIKDIIKEIATLPVEDISIPNAELEEIFMSYYID